MFLIHNAKLLRGLLCWKSWVNRLKRCSTEVAADVRIESVLMPVPCSCMFRCWTGVVNQSSCEVSATKFVNRLRQLTNRNSCTVARPTFIPQAARNKSVWSPALRYQAIVVTSPLSKLNNAAREEFPECILCCVRGGEQRSQMKLPNTLMSSNSRMADFHWCSVSSFSLIRDWRVKSWKSFTQSGGHDYLNQAHIQ